MRLTVTTVKLSKFAQAFDCSQQTV